MTGREGQMDGSGSFYNTGGDLEDPQRYRQLNESGMEDGVSGVHVDRP